MTKNDSRTTTDQINAYVHQGDEEIARLKIEIQHDCDHLRDMLNRYEDASNEGGVSIQFHTPNLSSTALQIEVKQGRLKAMIESRNCFGALQWLNEKANKETCS